MRSCGWRFAGRWVDGRVLVGGHSRVGGLIFVFPWVDVRVVVGGFSRSCAAVGGRSRVGGWVLAFLRVGARGVHESVGGFSRSFGLTFAGRWVDFRVPAFLRVDIRGSVGGIWRSRGWKFAGRRVDDRIRVDGPHLILPSHGLDHYRNRSIFTSQGGAVQWSSFTFGIVKMIVLDDFSPWNLNYLLIVLGIVF